MSLGCLPNGRYGRGLASASVRIGVLGQLEVVGEGSTTPSRPRERAVVAFLALRAGRVASVADLVDALWGDDPPATAVKSLQSHVARARASVGRGALVAAGEGYRLEVEPDAVDANRFELLLDHAIGHTSAGRHAEALAVAEDALALWRGDPYADLPDSDVARAESTRLLERRAHTEELRVRTLLDLGRHELGVAVGEQLVSATPLRERRWALLMEALARAGRQADALRAYQRARTTLVDELGIEPGSDLRQLEALILSGEPLAPSAPTASPPTSGAAVDDGPPGSLRIPLPRPVDREASRPLSGRRAELDALWSAWERVRTGAPLAVFLAGEPGIGKTRLAAEFARRAHGDGALVLFGRCDEAISPPFQPFVDALDRLVAEAGGDLGARLGKHAGELSRFVPRLAERLPDLAPPTVADPETERHLLLRAVTEATTALAAEGGVLLVIDDLHWASAPTIQLVRHLLRELEHVPLLVLATYRDTDIDRSHALGGLLADLRREAETERIGLAGLDLGEVVDLVVEATSAPNPEELEVRELAATAHSVTSGNPLYLHELLRHLVESGALLRAERRWIRSADVSDQALPEGLRDVIGRRLSSLSSDANEVLAWAALAARDIPLEIIVQATRWAEPRVIDALEEAVDARVLEEVGPDRYRFGHAVVRATLADEIRTSRWVRMHRALGEAYEACRPQDASALAHHFSEAAPAGEAARALAHLRTAAEQAVDQLAPTEGVSLYERALEVLADTGHDDDELRCDLLLGLGRARRLAGGDYRPVVEEAVALARTLGDGERMASALLTRDKGWQTTSFAVNRPLVDQLEECLGLLSEADSPTRALVLGTLGLELHYSGELDRVGDLLDAAVDMARRVGDPATLAEVLVIRRAGTQGWPDAAVIEQGLADVEEMASLLDAGPATHRGRTARSRLALSRVGALWAAGRLDDPDAVPLPLDEAVTPQDRWTFVAHHAAVALLQGDHEEAAALTDRTLALGQEAGEDDALPLWGNLTLFRLRQEGRATEAAAMVEQVLASGVPGEVHWTAALALLRCEADEPELGRPSFEAAIAAYRDHPWDTGYLPTGVTLAFVAAELGARDDGRWLLDTLAPLHSLVAVWPAISLIGPVTLGLGRLAALLGERDLAETHLAHAEAWARRRRTIYQLAEAILHRAANLHLRCARGDDELATRLVDECRQLAAGHGFGTLLRRADAEPALRHPLG
jgi:DNA-binding SARP family transcriptional activator